LRVECRDFFGESLFFLGEIGFNDYSFSMNKGKNVQQLRPLVPLVIRTITMAIEVVTVISQSLHVSSFQQPAAKGKLIIYKSC
jgi:hypothetical protein